MDGIDSHHPTSLETKNDSERDIEKKYVLQDHHLIKNTRVTVLDKLTTTEIYSGNTPTSQKYFGKVFPNENYDWKKIYILPRVVTIKSFQCNFQ